MESGTIKNAIVGKNYGFIKQANELDVFFHRSVLDDDLEFGEQLQERRVRFDAIETDRGPKAIRVAAE